MTRSARRACMRRNTALQPIAAGSGRGRTPPLAGDIIAEEQMDETQEKRIHDTIGFVGLRAQATAVGLLQLSAELVRAGVLDVAAMTRIKDAIAKDIALSRPRSVSREEYERTIRLRLDRLFSGAEHLSTTPPQ